MKQRGSATWKFWGLMMGLAALAVLAFGNTGFAAEQKVFQWKFSTWAASGNKITTPSQKWWADEVEKRSKGRIKIRMYYVDELNGPKEMMQALKGGLADVVCHVPFYAAGETPIWLMTYLPFTNLAREDWNLLVINRLGMESKPFIDETNKFDGVYAGCYISSGAYNLMGKKPVRNINDLKGLRIRLAPDLGAVLKNFGVSPMAVPATEFYTALDSGVIDMVAHTPLTLHAYKIDEISKYLILGMDMQIGPAPYFINKNSWNALPDDLKKVIESVRDDCPKFYWDYLHNPDLHASAAKMIKEKKIQVLHFPKEDREKLIAKAEPEYEAWAKRCPDYNAAKQALADHKRIAAEVMAKYPNGAPGITRKDINTGK
ncbi:MAG: Lactate-binding periplasmic protein precursor [Syntrophaceae bacterium PtaU1.Bin231]|nr:MAG: Lactate-binding periplasmic protein precursor [Syntrophaceae bacterium PtaU1.Bin231]